MHANTTRDVDAMLIISGIVSFQPNALETWCARSALRNRVKNEKPYDNSQNELEQLAKASMAVLGK